MMLRCCRCRNRIFWRARLYLSMPIHAGCLRRQKAWLAENCMTVNDMENDHTAAG